MRLTPPFLYFSVDGVVATVGALPLVMLDLEAPYPEAHMTPHTDPRSIIRVWHDVPLTLDCLIDWLIEFSHKLMSKIQPVVTR